MYRMGVYVAVMAVAVAGISTLAWTNAPATGSAISQLATIDTTDLHLKTNTTDLPVLVVRDLI